MNSNAKVFVALGLLFFILAWVDCFVYSLANQQSRLFGKILWKLDVTFGDDASWLFAALLGGISIFIAYIESRRGCS